MLSEAIHSFADTGNELLLLWGLHRGAKEPDAAHPFGYGMEVYFWSFVVALLLFASGGAVSIYEGVIRLYHPEPISDAWINYCVIAAAMVFESISFTVALKEFRQRNAGAPFFASLIRSKDPSLFIVVLEDSAALIGLALAATGVAGTQLGWLYADGTAAILIGVMLVVVAAFLARETRSLLVGEAAPTRIIRQIESIMRGDERVESVAGVLSLQLGPGEILIAIRLRLAEGLSESEFRSFFAVAVDRIRRVDSKILHVLFAPEETEKVPAATPVGA